MNTQIVDSRDGDRLDFLERVMAEVKNVDIGGVEHTVRVWSFAGSPSLSIRQVIDQLMQEKGK